MSCSTDIISVVCPEMFTGRLEEHVMICCHESSHEKTPPTCYSDQPCWQEQAVISLLLADLPNPMM